MNDSLILAKRFLEHHKNPIRRFELPGTKLFIPKDTEDEIELVKGGISCIKYAIEQERVERRCARVTAHWLPDEKLAKLNKGGKILNTYGFVNKDGRFLYPEEALLLLEINRIELFLGKVPLSIQEAYDILIGSNIELKKYLAYRKLSLEGFRVLRSDHRTLKSEEKQETSPSKKCRLENDAPEKLMLGVCNIRSNKVDEEHNQASSNTCSREMINDIFKKLQENGPKQCLNISIPEQPDYKVFSPDNMSKTGPDFNLNIRDAKHFDPNLGFLNTRARTIINYASSEFSGYFQIAQVRLPTLL